MPVTPNTHKLGASVSGVNYPWVDIGIAGEYLVLAAAELGLGTCWIGWIRAKAVRRSVGWPSSVKPAAVITVGYARPNGRTAEPPPVVRQGHTRTQLTTKTRGLTESGCPVRFSRRRA